MSVRCQVICKDGATPSEHDFPTMPRTGDIFVFPGQYSVYEIAEIRHEREFGEGAADHGPTIAIVVRKGPEPRRPVGLRA